MGMWGMWPFVSPLDTGTWLAPTVISSAIAGLVALATHFSSQKAKTVETREDIRTEAYDQAKAFYTDMIDRQDHEIGELRTSVTEALRRAAEAEITADAAKAAVRKLTISIQDKDAEIARLRAG
jgi:hypothetical protein